MAVAVAMCLPVTASVVEGAIATWLSPQPGQICSGGKVEVAVGYNTGSKLEVTAVELYVNGQFYQRKVLRTPATRGVCSFMWDTTRVEQGTHNLVVKVYAGDQVISKVYGTGTVGPNAIGGGTLDVRPPVVTFANIKAGDVIKGTKTIKINAVDDSGKNPMVSLLVDENLKLLKNTPPYTYDLDSTTYADGDHSLKTFAYDAAGNRSDPAVIKVAFRNGAAAPSVTTLSVHPEEDSEPAPAEMTKITPPSMAASSAPSIREGAAREVSRLEAGSSVAPVVAQPKPAKVAAAVPKPEVKVAAAPEPVQKPASVDSRVELSAPTLSTSPIRMASAASSANLRNAELASAEGAPGSAEEPVVVPAPQASGVRSATASRLPSARQAIMSAPVVAEGPQSDVPDVTTAPKPAVAAPAKVSEPKQAAAAAPVRVASAPRPSGPVKMALASQLPAPHAIKHHPAASDSAAAAPEIVGKPFSSSARNVPIGQRMAVRAADIAKASASDAIAAAPNLVTPPAPPKVTKSMLKQVRVAMAPDFRTAAKGVQGNSAVSKPEITSKPAIAARLEKAVAPAKGKVKARSFFEDLGGVLFWDQHTRTVTACVKGMVIEMQIGSRKAKVNGHSFTMDSAPYVVNGRTFMEARTFEQACSLLDSLRTIGKAEIK